MRAADGNRGLVYVLGCLALLLVAWDVFAQRYDASRAALRETGRVFDRAARDLGITREELPAPARPRVVVYGSSQIATVKRDTRETIASIPHRLADALEQRGSAVEVADFSDDGQQLVESLLVHLATVDVSQPSAIVVGVSLFAMTRINVRAEILEEVDGRALESAVRRAFPADADPAARRALLAWSADLPVRDPALDETVQSRIDAVIGRFLERHVAAYANRRAMYRELIERPGQLAIQRRNRARAGETISSSYAIGPAYAPSLLALETIRRSAEERGVPFLVVSLPFDHARPPIPFDAATQARVVADLSAIAMRAGQPLLELGDLLASDHFGDYEDGSPDNLHFDAAGHEAVARRIAERVAPLVGGRR